VTADDLTAALHACAAGLYPPEAGTALLISNGTFLHRDDFTSRFIEHGTSGGTPMAAIDWEAAITALTSAGFSNCRPASPAAYLPTSATPSPASTTATSPGWSPRSCTRPENTQGPADIDDHF
jgi:hypothetical protein